MFGSPSEATILRALLEKEIKASLVLRDKLDEIRDLARESDKLITDYTVSEQSLAFRDVLLKIREIVDE